MAYDEKLAERVREQVAKHAEPVELKMFGGLAFMVNTHMACGIMGEDLMVRVGADGHAVALARGAEEMDFTGRPMRGFVVVRAAEVDTDAALRDWVDGAVEFARSQPAKPPKKPKQRKKG